MRFAWEYTQDPTLFTSFAVIFQGPARLAEEDFERNLWDRVQSLTDKDAWQGQQHDPRVSADPDDPHFALSFGGLLEGSVLTEIIFSWPGIGSYTVQAILTADSKVMLAVTLLGQMVRTARGLRTRPEPVFAPAPSAIHAEEVVP